MRDRGHSADVAKRDLGPGVPADVVASVAEKVAEVASSVSTRNRSLANEDQRTGALTSQIDGLSSVEVAGWEVSIAVTGFSTHTKEPIVGADFGIVVDIRNGGEHTSKALWIQAKLADSIPEDPLDLPRLRDQAEKMRRRTAEGYALVYLPNGMTVFRVDTPETQFSFATLVREAIECKRGDRDPSFIADTTDRDRIVEVFLTGRDGRNDLFANVDWLREGF